MLLPLTLGLTSLTAGSPGPVAQGSVCRPTWSKLPAVNPGTGDNQLLTLAAISASDVWAGGVWNATSYGPLVEHWNGASWAVSAALGSLGFVNGLAAAAPNDVWAVGDSTVPIQHWNGTTWSASVPPLPRGASSVAFFGVTALSPTDVWAVGRYVKAGAHSLTEHWNGTSWTRVASPDAATGGTLLRSVAGTARNDVWAVGYSMGTSEQPVVEHWDGSAWSLVASPTFPYPAGENDLFAVSAVTTSDAWAVGMVGNAGSWQGVIEHWDGRTWSVARLLEDAPTALLGLRAVTSDDVWAAGNSNNGPLVEHWDGRAWTRVSTPVAAAAGQGLDAVDALPNGDLWAAGDQAVAGRWATLVERVCPIKVTDDGFLPPTTKAGLGLTTVWQLPTTNAAAQAVADATGMTQFDSGTRAPGGSFVYPFAAAGTYTVSDPMSGYSSKVKVPVSAPGSATVRQPFTVKWASTPATTGFVFDVQIRPPGAAAWSAWRTGATTTSAAYVGSVAGSYQFRARLRKSGVASSGYSPAITVTVG